MKWSYRYSVLVVAMFAQVSQQGSRLAISPVVPQIIDWFEITEGTIGLALTGMWAAYALFQFPSGLLGDRIGERRVILFSMGMMGIGSLLVALSPSYPFFGAFLLVLGAGTGLYYSVAASLLTKLFDETGQALGIHSAAGAAAGLFVPVVAAAVGVRFGWQVAVLFGLVMAVPSIVLFLLFVRPIGSADDLSENPREDQLTPSDDSRTEPPTADKRTNAGITRSRPHSDEPRDRTALLGDLLHPSAIFVTLLAAMGVFTWQAMMSFYPTFLIEYHGFSTQGAGSVFGLIFLFSTVSQAIAGKLSDVVGRDTVIAVTFTVAALAYAGVLTSPNRAVTIVLTALIGAGMSWFPVMQARIMDGFPDADRGSRFGLVRTVYMFVGASGSAVTGTLVDVGGWTIAYGFLIALLGVGIVGLVSNRLLRLGL